MFYFYLLYVCICHTFKYFVYILFLINSLFKLLKWIWEMRENIYVWRMKECPLRTLIPERIYS
jgi:hypothetical protein